MGFTPDFLSGTTLLELQRANPGAATLTGSAVALTNLTGKLLIVYSIGAIGGGSISCQIQSCTSIGGAGPVNFGSAFGIAAGTGSFQIDLETFPTGFIRSVVTIVTGSTPVSIIGFAFQKIV